MRFMYKLGLIATLLVAAGTFSRANDTAVRQAIEEQYAKFNRAIKSKNIEAFAEPYAPGYTSRGPDGKTMTQKQEVDGWNQDMKEFTTVSRADSTIEKLVVNGTHAVATVRIQLDTQLIDRRGRFGPKGRKHVVKYDAHEINTWSKTAKGWRIKQSELQPGEKETVDGKPRTPGSKPKNG